MGAKDGRRPAPGYETRDVSLRVILWTGAGLVILVAAASLAMLWLFGAFAAREDRMQPAPSPLARPMRQEPPEPRLQTHPREDLAKMRSEEEALLTSYGWVDREAGIARIPIDRAMEIVAEQGIPPSPPPPPAKTEPADGESR